MFVGDNFLISYAQGAPKATFGKITPDENIDRIDNTISSKIRKQAKYLNVNGPDIPAMVSSSTARTIGVGINTQVESPDQLFNDAAEALIEEFNLLRNGELTNKHHFDSAMRAISDFELLDGGIIVRHHYNPTWPIPYKYELVSIDMVDTSKNFYTYIDPNEDYTIAGLVINKWNQVTGVWLYTTADRRQSELVPITNLTYYSEVWASLAQQAGISRLSSILPTLDRVDQYTVSELEAAIESAKAGGYLRSDAFNEIIGILRDRVRTSTIAGAETDIKSTALYDMMVTIAQGRIKQSGLTPIPHSDEIIFNPQSRDGIYKQLNDTSENKMAAAIGMSAISMYGKAADANYSAIKFSSEMDQHTANIRFNNIEHKVIREIHNRLIRVGIQIGRIPNRVAYWKNPSLYHRFSYLRMVSVDIEPAKTAGANNLNLKNGIMTPKEIVEKRTGRKYEDFLTEKVKAEILEQKIREKLYAEAGLEVPQAVPNALPA